MDGGANRIPGGGGTGEGPHASDWCGFSVAGRRAPSVRTAGTKLSEKKSSRQGRARAGPAPPASCRTSHRRCIWMPHDSAGWQARQPAQLSTKMSERWRMLDICVDLSLLHQTARSVYGAVQDLRAIGASDVAASAEADS